MSEVALAVVLLLGATLFIGSFITRGAVVGMVLGHASALPARRARQ